MHRSPQGRGQYYQPDVAHLTNPALLNLAVPSIGPAGNLLHVINSRSRHFHPSRPRTPTPDLSTTRR